MNNDTVFVPNISQRRVGNPIHLYKRRGYNQLPIVAQFSSKKKGQKKKTPILGNKFETHQILRVDTH